MIVINTIEEFASVHQTELTSYLERKFSSMVKEYGCSMQDIGEVHIYQNDSEFLTMQEVNQATYELMEVIQVFNLDYLHLVEIVDDYYAKDIYVPVNRKEVI
jgi:hypothetical protein